MGGLQHAQIACLPSAACTLSASLPKGGAFAARSIRQLEPACVRVTRQALVSGHGSCLGAIRRSLQGTNHGLTNRSTRQLVRTLRARHRASICVLSRGLQHARIACLLIVAWMLLLLSSSFFIFFRHQQRPYARTEQSCKCAYEQARIWLALAWVAPT